MPFYKRFVHLPERSTTVESAILDLKKEMSAKEKDHFTLANDVAAFANLLGGVLLIGAVEDQGIVGEYPGIPISLADDVQTAFTDAVKDRCSPKPIYDFGRFPADIHDRHVPAVFVEPYVGGQLVGSIFSLTPKSLNARVG